MGRTGLVAVFGFLFAFGFGAVSLRAAEWRVPSSHPRLFLQIEDVGALKVRCGVAGERRSTPGESAAFGLFQDEFERLKVVAAEIMHASARSDDLFVPALLHLVTGELSRPDVYTKYVAGELTSDSRERVGLDGLVALDWCWDAIDPPTRSRILLRLDRLDPLEAGRSPLDPLAFGRCLEALAAAIAVDERESRDVAAIGGKLQAVRNMAGPYFRTSFPLFCRQRGVVPTSPASGVWEEADIALACELWRCASGENLLKDLKESAGRMLEHYFYADSEYPALEHGFVHDDGSTIPVRPGQTWRGFVPVVPFVLAKHAGDPVAAWYANRAASVTPTTISEVDRYLWARCVYGPVEAREAPRKAMPLGRNFGGGWVAMRSGWTPGATVLLFDAGQPFWRARQHFDAGQFQIYRKGRLAIDSGDDVALQAVADQGGKTLIGGSAGDWDDFAQATIAHNCVTVIDRRFNQHIYGRPWPALGNQRLIERDYVTNEGGVFKTRRSTGALAAFETNSFYSYAAADLSSAYPAEVVRSIKRQVLFIHAGAVIVLDRMESVKAESVKTWHLQLPARPALVAASAPEKGPGATSRVASSGIEPIAGKQLHGVTEQAGIWEIAPSREWVSVANEGGRLLVRTLLPEGAQRWVVGGPMKTRKIEGGASSGRTYHGGEPFGYEYHLWPARFLKAPNASYELVKPIGLGPQFGVSGAWGRYEVSPADAARSDVFLHVLIPTDAEAAHPPAVNFESTAHSAHIELTFDDQLATVELSLDDLRGRVTLRDALGGSVLFEQDLADTVKP